LRFDYWCGGGGVEGVGVCDVVDEGVCGGLGVWGGRRGRAFIKLFMYGWMRVVVPPLRKEETGECECVRCGGAGARVREEERA
jgi:hypothetical protein